MNEPQGPAPAAPRLNRITRYRLSRMDCPSEEQMVRLALGRLPIPMGLAFDLVRRELTVTHQGPSDPVTAALVPLDLDAALLESREHTASMEASGDGSDRRLLQAVLVINGLFFVLELTAGLFGRSMGLLADSLDMLADAAIYGLALIATRMDFSGQRRVALLAGTLQIVLAVAGLGEVLHRFLAGETVPDSRLMMSVSALALGANILSLRLLGRTKGAGLHLQASQIFTSSDIWANAGVILAGGLVALFHSRYPDLIIGVAVFALVFQGALRIFRLAGSKAAPRSP